MSRPSIINRLPELAAEVERVTAVWDSFWRGDRNRLVLADVNFPGGINFPRMHIGSRAFTPKNKLFSDPDAYLAYQLDRLTERLDMRIGDDFIPTLWPWFGVGVVQTAYGCPTTWPENDDPWTAPRFNTVASALENLPSDPLSQGILPSVIQCAKAWEEAVGCAIPVRITDIQSPLDVGMQIVEANSFFSTMFDEPQDVHALLRHISETTRAWIAAQTSALKNPWPASWQYRMPDGRGIGISDDAAVVVSPERYREFGAEYAAEVGRGSGGVFLHCCAQPMPLTQEHVRVIAQIPGLIGLETHIGSTEVEQVAASLKKQQVMSCLATAEDPVELSRALGSHRAIIYVVRTIACELDLDRLRSDVAAVRKAGENTVSCDQCS